MGLERPRSSVAFLVIECDINYVCNIKRAANRAIL